MTLEGVIKAGVDHGLDGIARSVDRVEHLLFDRLPGLAQLERKKPVLLVRHVGTERKRRAIDLDWGRTASDPLLVAGAP